MNEENFISLGFEKIEISAEESGDKPFHYYTLDLGTSGFSLISNDNDDAKKNGWFVEIFDYEKIRFYTYQDVSDLIRVINKGLIK